MLNPYFAFGVPIILLIGYIIFTLIKKEKFADYRRFVLTLISVFLATFSYQVFHYSRSIISTNSVSEFQNNFGYPANFLLLPFILGLILTLINLILLFAQFRKKE